MHGIKKSIKYKIIIHWYGDHGGGATPGLVSIPEVKSSSDLDCTVGAGLWELQDVAGHSTHFLIYIHPIF